MTSKGARASAGCGRRSRAAVMNHYIDAREERMHVDSLPIHLAYNPPSDRAGKDLITYITRGRPP